MVRVLRVIVAFVLSIVVLTASPLQGREYDDIAIVSQSASEIVFQFRPAELSWTSDSEGEFPEIGHAAVRHSPDRPAIPGRIVYIALPPASQTVFTDLISAGSVREGNRASLQTSSDSPGMTYPYPATAVITDDVFNLRGLQVARLILNPFQIIDAAGNYRFTTELTVRVRFAAASAAPVPVPAGLGPRDAFGDVLGAILLNPERAAEWRLPRSQTRAAAAAETDPFTGSDLWIAIHVDHEGIISITPNDLTVAGADLGAADPREFRLFAGPGRMIPTRMSVAPPELHEVAIAMTGDADGQFGAGDRFDFYAQSLNRWETDTAGNPVDIVHRYDRENVYWLALGGSFAGAPKRVATAPAMAPVAEATDYFSALNRVRHEREEIFRISTLGDIKSYFTWYWRNRQTDRIFMSGARLVESGRPARIEVASYSGAAHLRVNGIEVDPSPDVRLGGEDGTRSSVFSLPSFNPNDNFVLDLDPLGGGYYLDYYSIEYQRQLTLSGGAFRFPSPDTNALVTMVLADVSAPEVWDITDPFTPVRLSGLAMNGAVARFGLDQRAGSRSEFFAWEPSHRSSPSRFRMVERSDLYAPVAAADYLLIGPRAFRSALADFMAYRTSASGLATRFVAMEDIYDAFALGVTDPLAIRRFLRYAYRDWPDPAPVYALLVGDGSFDFLNHTLSASVNFVPPYVVADDESASDENYVYFGDKQVLDADGGTGENPFPDMLIGRWPVKTAAEIQNATAKIKQYESNASLGAWRSRFVMVADDEFGDRDRGSVAEIFHVRDAEEILRSYVPPWFSMQKIYLMEYPFDNPGCESPDASGCRKPAVNAAIVDALNEGVAVFNYLGHGNKDLLAHERVFQRTVELPTLTNTGMPTAVFTFSCSIGFFDDPRSEGMSEEWFRMPDGGAVAVVSATRLVLANANEALNKKFFELLLNEEKTGIAASLYTAKLFRQYFARCQICGVPPCPCENDRRYMLLGDPAMKLGVPRNRVQFTTVEPDTFRALALTEVEGMIADTNGNLMDDFDGTVFLTVQDAPQERTYRVNDDTSVDYELPGGTLYRGQVDVSGGQFSFGFVVPKDIAYGRQGARIFAHAASAGHMAAGAADSIWIAGSSGVLEDTVGPQITLESETGEIISDGFLLAQGSELVLRIFDTSGVNLTGAPGHRIEVYAGAGDTPLADLTGLFVYEPGRFTRGSVRFVLPELDKGQQALTIRAWDNANNSSLLAVEIEITAPGTGDQFRISEFLNYPNPFASLTTFYFRATRTIDDARIRVFTLAGRLIWEYIGAVDGMTTWDGADLDGDPVGNGVYLAQIEVLGRVAPDGRAVDKKAYKEIKLVLAR